MVIAMGLGFILFAIVAVLIKRYFVRRRDRVATGFNSGITHRSAPMTQSLGPFIYNNQNANDSRQRPLTAPAESETSLKYPPKIRERDMQHVPSKQKVSSNDSENALDLAQEGTIVKDWEDERATLGKGKGRMIAQKDI